MKIQEKEEVHFSPPVEEVQKEMGVKNPRHGPLKSAASYTARVAEKRAAMKDIKGKGKPLGGAPPIPPGKMQQLIPRPEQVEDDELPPDLYPQKKDPEPIQGVGSGYPFNQAVSSGQTDGPVSLREAKKMTTEAEARKVEEQENRTRQPLSKETITLMEKSKEATENPPESEQDDSIPKHDLDGIEKELVEQQKRDYYFGEVAQVQGSLISKERKEVIESRLQPLDLASFVTSGEVTQRISIVPDQFWIVLRTFSEREFLSCLHKLYDEKGSQAYIEELLNVYRITCSVVAINDRTLISHLKDGEVDDDLFKKKLNSILNLPVQLMADIGVQVEWFNERVNKLLTFENLKNG